MTPLRLTPDASITVLYDDRTPFGSPVGDRPERSMRSILTPVLAHDAIHGRAATVAKGPALLDQVVASRAFGRLARRTGGSWEVCPSVLHPDPALAPAAGLTVTNEHGGRVEARVGPADWPWVHAVLADLAGPGVGGHRAGDARLLVEALVSQGLAVRADAPTRLADQADVVFAGHNTVVLRGQRGSVAVDPYLLPHATTHPPGYQPLLASQLEPVDAIALTHSHPDHFDPGTLLRFPHWTTIIVPNVGRESLLSIDLATRVRELGFTDMVVLNWWDSISIGDVEVVALPFFGEQATDGAQLHPEVRNAGNTYVLRSPTRSIAVLADSGRDDRGDSISMAAEARRRLGPVDLLFCGYRGWSCFPVQLAFSSVSRSLLFVPREAWGRRAVLMNSVDDAVEIAASWEARHLVPYADGGAPWYWQRGLGPRLDGDAAEDPDFDPFPDRVLDALERRANAARRTRGLLLRPGDGVCNRGDDLTVLRTDGHAWPFATTTREHA